MGSSIAEKVKGPKEVLLTLTAILVETSEEATARILYPQALKVRCSENQIQSFDYFQYQSDCR